jgi:predicted S18 family serine protease
MTVQDAWSILKGEDNAATQYLDKTTSPELTTKFKPIIQAALQKVSATKYYADLVNAYNKLPMVQKVNPNLDDYATEKAIDGLFVMVAKEEKLIRDDPGARTTDLLKKVFGAQK